MSAFTAPPMIGFLGTGTITSALVTAFCERAQDFPFPILLSPRSRDKAAALKKAYPHRVTVCGSMQEVLDCADWVVLAVLPPAAEEVCRGLRFRPEQLVISLLPGKTLPDIRGWIGEVKELVHMVPLTFNAFCDGPIILDPPQEEVAAVFGHIGRVLEMENHYHASVLEAVTGCVTPFYAVLDTLVRWAQTETLPPELAADYITRFFSAVCSEAVRQDPAGIHTMATESTPGGLNLMAKDSIEQAGGFAAWRRAMEPVLERTAAERPQKSGTPDTEQTT